jgi:hypothetical protein
MSMAVSLPVIHGNSAPEFHRQYALLQYGEALKAIHQQIVLDCSDSVRTAMISALLIFCFESLSGNVTPTMTHIQSALEIVVKRISSEPHGYQIPSVGALGMPSASPLINDELLLAFMRIDRAIALSSMQTKRGATSPSRSNL